MPFCAKDPRLNRLRIATAVLLAILVLSAAALAYTTAMGEDGSVFWLALVVACPPALLLSFLLLRSACGREPDRWLFALASGVSCLSGVVTVGVCALGLWIAWIFASFLRGSDDVLLFMGAYLAAPCCGGLLCMGMARWSLHVYQAPEEIQQLQEGDRAMLFAFGGAGADGAADEAKVADAA
uniref:Transmembrane protein n=1 Tax=Alexandrium monilatum TaxID=311494 RepID=A0A7S4VYP7_9DINO|mmetsp:Transcript_7070/g.21487  ORF Transcript_7070/g.21487 Transcript_7070/m.21487 type:complete len:182 (-) Transcript_7070:273-818(-)